LQRSERLDRRLAPRLSAAKSAELIIGKARSNHAELHAKEFVDHAWRLSEVTSNGEAPRIVAVIVNRVALARICHEELSARIKKSGVSAESVLFIGRTREIDRRALMLAYQTKLESGHGASDTALFVVATQCIEAGADFDFDTMVTQAAPLDVLRQRFGRVNRLGKRLSVDAVILACRDEIDGRADDPLYGMRTHTTWNWLVTQSTQGRVDFGINALDERLKGEDVSLLTTEARDAPTVMPAYVDLWAQTHPMPTVDAEPALFLHGVPGAADVQIVWRADIELDDLLPERINGRTLPLLALMPPKSAEAVAVPIYAARAWLSGKTAAPVNDVEGSPDTEADSRTGRTIPAVRWRGTDNEYTGAVTPWTLRPGDIVVVAGAVGGCDEYGWLPEGRQRVTDVGEIARQPYTMHRFAFRVHRRLLEDAMHAESGVRPTLKDVELLWRRMHLNMQEARNERNGASVARWLLRTDGLPREWHETLELFTKARNVQVTFPYDDSEARQVTGLVLVAPHGIERKKVDKTPRPAIASTECDETGSFQTNSVTLAAHSVHVADKARLYVRSVGLPRRLAEDIVLAARLHDEGKRDSRFQLYLRRGDRLDAATDKQVLAKSNKGAMDRGTERRVRERVGLPVAWRHEADSVRRALESAQLAAAHDPQLVLWLVGTHHGYGRPLYPHTDPMNCGPQDLDFLIYGDDWSEIFAKLRRHYGAWELARFEAIIRLADHRASEEEQQLTSRSSGVSTEAEVA
jgi:CRISPR-associated endonuclease/helicase Cas3